MQSQFRARHAAWSISDVDPGELAMRFTVLVLLGLLFWAGSASAQIRIVGPTASVLLIPPKPLGSMSGEEARDTVQHQIRPTYWKEGALIGGVVGAIGGAFVGHGLCETSEEFEKNCTGSLFLGGLLGAVLLAGPGALIGGQFPKHQDSEANHSE